MGIREFQIKQFETQTGIKSARGAEANVLDRLSNLAYQLIKVVELERCGIRDGDGFWGSDVIGSICKEIYNMDRALSRLDEERRQALGLIPADESPIPF